MPVQWGGTPPPVPGAVPDNTQDPGTFRRFLAGGLRIGSGALASLPALEPGVGTLAGAAIAGAGESGAEWIEGREQNPYRIGTEAVLGAVPLGAFLKAGRPLESALKSGALAAFGEGGRELSEGNGFSPSAITTSGIIGGVTGGLLGRMGMPKKTAPVGGDVIESSGAVPAAGGFNKSGGPKGKWTPPTAPMTRRIPASGEQTWKAPDFAMNDSQLDDALSGFGTPMTAEEHAANLAALDNPGRAGVTGVPFTEGSAVPFGSAAKSAAAEAKEARAAFDAEIRGTEMRGKEKAAAEAAAVKATREEKVAAEIKRMQDEARAAGAVEKTTLGAETFSTEGELGRIGGKRTLKVPDEEGGDDTGMLDDLFPEPPAPQTPQDQAKSALSRFFNGWLALGKNEIEALNLARKGKDPAQFMPEATPPPAVPPAVAGAVNPLGKLLNNAAPPAAKTAAPAFGTAAPSMAETLKGMDPRLFNAPIDEFAGHDLVQAADGTHWIVNAEGKRVAGPFDENGAAQAMLDVGQTPAQPPVPKGPSAQDVVNTVVGKGPKAPPAPPAASPVQDVAPAVAPVVPPEGPKLSIQEVDGLFAVVDESGNVLFKARHRVQSEEFLKTQETIDSFYKGQKPEAPEAPSAPPTGGPPLSVERQQKIAFMRAHGTPEEIAALDKILAMREAAGEDPALLQGFSVAMDRGHRSLLARLKAADVAATPAAAAPPAGVGWADKQSAELDKLLKAQGGENVGNIDGAPAVPPNLNPKGGTTIGSGLGGAQDIAELIQRHPQFATRLGLAAGGALLGGMVNPTGNAALSAALGAAAGAGIPSLPGFLRSIGTPDHIIDGLPERLGTPEDVHTTVGEIARALPGLQRFSLLTSVTGLPANVFAGPWGSAIMYGLEMGLSGDARGFQLVKSLANPVEFIKEVYASHGTAMDLIAHGELGRAETSPLSKLFGPKTQTMLQFPGTAMTSGDVAARKYIMNAGFTMEEAQRATLTNNPELPAFDSVANLGKRSTALQFLFPFRRTIANIGEQGVLSTPGLGEYLQHTRPGGADPLRQRLVQQLVMTPATAGVSYELGKNVDPESGKILNKYVSNAGGKYSLAAGAGFAAGQAARAGRDPATTGVTNAVNNALPLPSMQPLTDLLKLFTEGKIPRSAVPAAFRELLGTPAATGATPSIPSRFTSGR